MNSNPFMQKNRLGIGVCAMIGVAVALSAAATSFYGQKNTQASKGKERTKSTPSPNYAPEGAPYRTIIRSLKVDKAFELQRHAYHEWKQNGDLDKAEDLYRESLTYARVNLEDFASLLDQKGKEEEAYKLYRECLKSGLVSFGTLSSFKWPRYAELCKKFGSSQEATQIERYLQQKRLARARASIWPIFTSTEPEKSAFLKVFEGKDYLHDRVRDYKKAEQSFREALKVKADYAPAHYYLAETLWRSGKIRRSVQANQQVISACESALKSKTLDANHERAMRRYIEGCKSQVYWLQKNGLASS